MPLTPAEQKAFAFLQKKARKAEQQLADQGQLLDRLQDIVQQNQDAPAFIDQIPGRRVPYLDPVEITVPANSTQRLQGRASISQDGPFVIQAIALFYERTAGPYALSYKPATTVDQKMADQAMQLGNQFIFNNPIGVDFDIEITDSASDRNWQNIGFPSALCAEAVGYMYMLPVSYLADPNTVIRIYATPKIAQVNAGQLTAVLTGYKIVQGASYQP